jgi:uncharacterized protein (TIGR01319 family)
MALEQEVMQDAPTIALRNLLGADFGSVNTRVVFIDQVDGKYRLISRAQAYTTADPPFGDVTVGLVRALEQITSLIGRFFLINKKIAIGGSSANAGADQFVATASGGRPMRALLVGLMPDVSLASGKNALGSVYVDLVDTLGIGDLRTEEEQVNTILRQRPDLIFIVGGTDNGATNTMINLVKTVRLAVSFLPAESRPVVLYAGNEALTAQVQELLDNEVNLFTARNVRPTLETERLAGAQLELAVAYGAYKANAGGFADVLSLSKLGVLPTANSFTNIVRFLGEQPGAEQGVLIVDVGASTVTLCATIRKQPFVNIRSDLGLGQSAVSSVELIGTDNIARWLSYPVTPIEVMDYAYNKTIKPGTVPMTNQELEMEFAIAREAIRLALTETRQNWPGAAARSVLLPPMNPVIGAGAVLTQNIEPGLSAMLLLDALQPTGITKLRLDPYGVMATLGAVAYVEPLVTVQVLETGGLLSLGTALSPEGQTRDNDAMQVTVKYPGGRTVKRIIPNNSLRLIELSGGQTVQVQIKLARGLTINGRRRLTVEVEGGAAGIICDTRGRPLRLPTDIGKRKEALERWYAGARGLTNIPANAEKTEEA